MTTPSYRHDQFNPGHTDNRYGESAPVAAPSTNGGWAATTIIFFWPLAFVAFSRALSVPMLWAQGRHHEAQEASESVARLGKIALVTGIVLMILAGMFYAFLIYSVSTDVQPLNRYPDLSSYSSGGN